MRYALANQDINTSVLTLEMTWRGMDSPQVRAQCGKDMPPGFFHIQGSTINYYVVEEELKPFVEACAQAMKNSELLERIEIETIRTAQAIRELALAHIDNYQELTDEEIGELFVEMAALQSECVNYGSVVAYADIFGDISNQMTDIVSKRKDLKNPRHMYSQILGSPEEPSLTEEAKIEVNKENLDDYFWLEQGYSGRGLRKEDLEHMDVEEQSDFRREELLEELQLSDEEWQVFVASQRMMRIKMLRADSRQYIHVLANRIADHLASRKGWPIHDIENMYAEEIRIALKKDRLPDDIEQRSNSIVVGYHPPHDFIVGEAVHVYLKEHLDTSREQDEEVTGQIAYGGRVEGKVRIVLGAQHMSKVKEGDILVSRATSPQLLPAMKKAAAFVTDVGGITSHAAIVARELGKPAVVGTKYATEIFMDGDEVEVDAEQGMVKKI